MAVNVQCEFVSVEEYMTKDAQIEKEETLKKVLSGDLEDTQGGKGHHSALLNTLCAQVGIWKHK